MATNHQILEALWGLGYSEEQLRGISTRGRQQQWLTELQTRHGIRGRDIDMAVRSAEWRANPKKPVGERVHEYLQHIGVGYRPIYERARELMQRPGIRRPGGEPAEGDIFAAAREILGPQQFTNMLIKVGRGDALQTPQIRGDAPAWNPLRGDVPQFAQQGPGRPTIPLAPGTDTGNILPPPPGPQPPPGGPGGPAPGLAPAAGAPGAGGPGAGAPPVYVPPPPRTPEEKLAYVKRHYGGNAWFLDIPEVRDLLMNAAGEELSMGELQDRLVETTWWRVTDADARQWYAQERSDPATALSIITAKAGDINQMASTLGVTLDPARARSIAESAARYRWTQVEMRQAIAAEMQYDPTELKGAAAQRLREKASDYFVPMTDDAIRKWGQDIVGGTVSEEAFDGWLKEQAKGMFPTLSAAIDRGQNVKQYVDPYYSLAERMLGVARESIDFKDPKWLAPIMAVNDKGERSVMSLEQWETKLRTDERYGFSKTQAAKDEAVALAGQIATMFGARAS